MASFTIGSGVTNTVAKTVTNNDTGTIASGGTLSDTTDITWTGGSASPGVIINNSGTITATTRAIDTSGSFSTGSFTLNNNAGATLISSGNDAFRINTNITNGTITVNNSGLLVSGAVDGSGHVVAHASGQALDFGAITSSTAVVNITNHAGATIGASGDDAIRPGSGHITITNDGLIDATASANRAINLNDGTTANISEFHLNNSATGVIQSQGDAVRITATTLSQTAAYNVTVDNAGTIQSTGTGANNGQAIDFNDLNSPLGHVTITNETTGIIHAADADALRGGTNATINNYGQITSSNGTLTSTGNDGIDFQATTGGIVNNFAGGLIDGARHGITGSNPITVNNAGTIIGELGSGINMDTAGTTTTIVNNTGTIIGISSGNVSSGDAVDVDGLVLVNNYGSIQALGTSTVSTSEGVTVGGGTINNYAGATIYSSQNAIDVDAGSDINDVPINAFAATTVYNEGLIQGDSGVAISITDTFTDTITNKGTILGSISTGDGGDVLNLYTGSTISGLIDGGAGTDSIDLFGTGSGTIFNVANVENLNVEGGSWTVLDDQSYTGGITIAGGASLQIGNGGTAGSLAGDVADNGTLIFDRADASSFTGTISGTGTVRVENGTVTLNGHDTYTGGTEIVSGTLDVATADGAGTGAITLDAGSQTLTIEQTALTGGAFANTIVGFAAGDAIDLANIGTATAATLGAGNVLTVTGGASGPITLHLDPAQNYFPDVFSVASDGHGGTVVTVGPDHAPVTAAISADANEDTGNPVTLAASFTDQDSNDPDTFAIDTTGTAGTVINNGDGTFTYNPNGQFEALAQGETATDTFTYTVTDSHGQSSTNTATVTLHGENDAPTIAVATGQDTGSVQEDAALQATGQFTATDIDHGALLTWSVAGNGTGTYGSLSVDQTGQWAYALNNNAANVQALTAAEHVTDTFTVIVQDEFGASSLQTVTVNIAGTNDAPTISGVVTGTAQEDTTLTATGQLAAADIDHGSAFTWSVAGNGTGTYGSLSVDQTGQWTYALNNNAANIQALTAADHVTDTFTVAVDDGHGDTTTQLVTVNIAGTNDAPTISGVATGNVQEDTTLTATGQLAAADVDHGSAFAWSVANNGAGTYGSLSINQTGQWVYTLNNNAANVQSLAVGQTVHDSFTVAVNDGHGDTTDQLVTLNIAGTNDGPVAVANINGVFFKDDDDDHGHNSVSYASVLTVNAAHGVLANDTDVDHDALRVSSVSIDHTTKSIALGGSAAIQGDFGTLTLGSDGSYTYAAGREGHFPDYGLAQDRFTYTVNDGHGGLAQTTLTISVLDEGEQYLAGTVGGTLHGGNGNQVLDGSLGHQTLYGDNGSDFLIGGDGDTLVGGRGHDTFVFEMDFGKNIVTDFRHDDHVLQFDSADFSSARDVLNHAASDGHGDTIITLDALNTVTLMGVDVHSLHTNDFLIV